jgi:hypothetical protein
MVTKYKRKLVVYGAGMKIFFFPYCGETMGGSHVSSLTLIKELKKKNYNILIGIHKFGIFHKYCKNKKINIKFLNLNFYSNKRGILLNIIFFIGNLFFYINFIKKNKIKIIHINDYRMLNTWAIPAYLSGIKKIVFHQRSIMPQSLLIKINLYFVSNIISVSKFVMMTLSKKNQKKTDVITNPINEIKTSQVNNSNLIGFVGNDFEIKRSDIFLKFAESLIKKKTKFRFLYVGNISKKKIKIIYEEYPVLKNKLKFTRFLENPHIAMRKLKFIICPAENEGFGRVPLEAAYLHVPCILSYSGGHKEFKSFKLCLYVKKNKVSNYLNIYKKILNDKLKKKLIQNGINYNKKFTLPRVHVSKVINIYKL